MNGPSNRAPSALLAGLAVAVLLLVSTGILDRFYGLHREEREARRRTQESEAVRNALVTNVLNLKHFPAGVYVYAEGGTGETFFESPTGELSDVYQSVRLPARGAWALKLLIRESGRIDFTTRGLIRSGGNADEKRLVSARICTQINENPRLSLFTPDPDVHAVHDAIFRTMRAALVFRDERVAVIERPDVPPLILVEEGRERYAELGDWRVDFATDRDGVRVVKAARTEPADEPGDGGTAETQFTLSVRPGDRARVVTVKRAMVNEAVVGTVIPWTANGFAGRIDLLVGIDNTERITGVTVLSHDEQRASGRRLLARASDFLKQFDGLLVNDVGLKSDGAGGIVDAVTGATRTSRGITLGIRAALLFNEKMNLEEYGGEQ